MLIKNGSFYERSRGKKRETRGEPRLGHTWTDVDGGETPSGIADDKTGRDDRVSDRFE